MIGGAVLSYESESQETLRRQVQARIHGPHPGGRELRGSGAHGNLAHDAVPTRVWVTYLDVLVQ